MKIHSTSRQAINPGSVKKAKEVLPEDSLLEIVADCFKALSDMTRLKILYVLLGEPVCVRDLAIVIGISESGISHQLNELKDKRLVKAERDGNIIYYSIAYEHIHNLLKEAEYYAYHIRQNLPDHLGEK
jgi:DNA-binding transcriptional ArsR family regulator